MAEDKKAEKAKTIDTKAMLKDLGEKKAKVKFNDRIKIEILEDTRFYKKGQIVTPHRTFGEELIKEKIGKEIKG